MAVTNAGAEQTSVRQTGILPPAWLRQIMEDQTEEAPRLYAWTTRHLSSPPPPPPPSSSSSSKEDDDTTRRRRKRRIHILGIGNMGRLYSACLSRIPAPDRPPITLVVHRRELLEHWARDPGIELKGGVEGREMVYRCDDFDVEWWTEERPPPGEKEVEVEEVPEIANIVIATKAADAMTQVDRLRRYLGPNSTVAFAQNGVCRLWPPLGEVYVRTRYKEGSSGPNWIACVNMHGVYSEGRPFRSVHAAPATALVGPVLTSTSSRATSSSSSDSDSDTFIDDDGGSYLMRQISRAPSLEARQVSRKELWTAQLEKLVVNVVINPLTAVLRCKRNGEIFSSTTPVRDDDDDRLPIVIDELLREASACLSALIRDEGSDEILLSHSDADSVTMHEKEKEKEKAKEREREREELLDRFSFASLKKTVLEVGEKVKDNTSSMAQDMAAGKRTEIDEMNGWLVDTANVLQASSRLNRSSVVGEELRLRLPTHEKLIQLVKSREHLSRGELCERLLD
ncbi:6-phosphogluconate dehydrogenase C-terminal domain-like protein [Xylariaceae sp. FL0594]|nr:6-phosphogluconate dehydrogenase C-terminal domain-like protein [Xylariaceae sp. FL0594]